MIKTILKALINKDRRLKIREEANSISNYLGGVRAHLRFGGFPQLRNYVKGKNQMKMGTTFFNKLGSKERFCPCCGWEGHRFMPYFSGGYTTLDVECFQCKSHARHRSHFYYYTNDIKLFEQEGKLLYFAPEKGILPLLKSAKGLVVETSDYEGDSSDHNFNIMDIDAKENTYDFVLCHRVIEHVSDDRKAMSEIYRVLKPGGLAIISVPIIFDQEKTIEFGKPNPDCDMHYYDYSPDFIERIPKEFDVKCVSFEDFFDKETYKRLAIYQDCLYECRK